MRALKVGLVLLFVLVTGIAVATTTANTDTVSQKEAKVVAERFIARISTRTSRTGEILSLAKSFQPTMWMKAE